MTTTITAANIDATKISSSIRVLKNSKVEWVLRYDGATIVGDGLANDLLGAMDAADAASKDLGRIADRVRFAAYAANEAANFALRAPVRNRRGF